MRLTAETSTSLARTTFETNALRDAATADMASVAREIAAVDATGDDAEAQRVLARAEVTAAANLHTVATAMGSAPPSEHPMYRTVASTTDDWPMRLQEQRDQANRAETYGGLANYSIAVIAVLAGFAAAFEVRAAWRRTPGPG